jgi:hypothetical protein
MNKVNKLLVSESIKTVQRVTSTHRGDELGWDHQDSLYHLDTLPEACTGHMHKLPCKALPLVPRRALLDLESPLLRIGQAIDRHYLLSLDIISEALNTLVF